MTRSSRRWIGRVLVTLWIPVASAGAQSRSVARPRAVPDSAAAAAASEAATVAKLAAETRAYAQELRTLRREYLARASWADLGDRCNPGALRVFTKDTTPALQQSLRDVVERMEQTILLYGAGQPLAAADSRALLRVIVGWEAGIDRPRWDEDGAAVHRAVATGLTGEVPDPTKAGCLLSPMMSDTVTFVVPSVGDMEFPKAPRPRVKAYFGREAQSHARNDFFTAVGSKTPDAELAYIVLAPIVIWQDYAVVGVNRPRERGGFAVASGSNGGAVYLLRRVGSEWRLLSIVRSWGS